MKADLERRVAELNAEIRRYPAPIARCDEQLTALLEERSRLLSELKKPGGCPPLGVWSNDGGINAA